MKYRETELLDRTDVGETGTKTIDINVLDPISRIDITWHAYAAGYQLYQLANIVSKIELVDGSDVLFSMSGLEAQGLNIYDRKVPTMNTPTYNRGNWVMAIMGIDFGRWLYDTELAFVPGNFRNPQLKVTFNEHASYAASDNFLEIFAHCFDEKAIAPVGFLMSKNHYAYDPLGDNKYAYIDLPTDHTIRQMLIRGYKAKVDPLDVVDEARLSEENDKRVVFDLELRRYFYRMLGQWRETEEYWCEYGHGEFENNDMFFTPTSYMTVPTLTPLADQQHPWLVTPPRGGWLDWRSTPGLMTFGRISGYLPNHCIQIPFGVQAELDSWYDAQNKSSIKLRLLSSTEGDGSLISVLLQQLRRY